MLQVASPPTLGGTIGFEKRTMLHMWHQPADAEPEMPGSGSDQTYTESHGCTEPPRLKLIFGDLNHSCTVFQAVMRHSSGLAGRLCTLLSAEIRAAGSEQAFGTAVGGILAFLVMATPR
eukprot:CAMPEP_0173063632 /NCGR_PEP_ID=MMETSP1102-20130122/4503_1 /TAXON_ID=49646 /ORGANISM="Geminigera sp., Strain Caron Lab Isolate" /LENGTH=118 /DNA_ID=CAMNT_0013930479 /DNA_START=239 /DNA_END=592 /DNA_ORIENTATION=+